MLTALAKLTPDLLRNLAGHKVFERGQTYWEDQRVVPLFIDQNRLIVQSFGSGIYKTEIFYANKQLDGHCTCPAMQDFGLCKHWVAAGLCWIHLLQSDQKTVPSPAVFESGMERLSAPLLKAMLLRQAHKDPILQQAVLLLSQTLAREQFNVQPLAQFIVALAQTETYAEWDEGAHWVSRMEELFEILDILLDQKLITEAQQLHERFTCALESAAEHIEDHSEIDELWHVLRDYRHRIKKF